MADPRKEALDHPSAWQDGKADLIRGLLDDFDDDVCGGSHALMIVAAICGFDRQSCSRARNIPAASRLTDRELPDIALRAAISHG